MAATLLFVDDVTGATSTAARQTAASASGATIFLTSIHSGDPAISTTASASRYLTQRSTGGSTPTTQVPEKGNSRTRNPAQTYTKIWGTAPTLSGNPVLFQTVGFRRERVSHWYPPRPWAMISLIDAENIDTRSSESTTFWDVSSTFTEESYTPNYQRFNGRRPIRRGLFHYHNMHRAYCHKTGSGSYDVNRNQNWIWVSRVDTVYRSMKNVRWSEYYSTPTIAPDGIASAEAFGTSDLTLNAVPSGIAGAEAFGNITVSIPVQVSNVGNIASAEVLGSPEAQPVLNASSITSVETAGSPIITSVASLSGVLSVEAFGTDSANVSVSPSGIASAETFGAGAVSANASVSGISSTETFGTIGTITNVSPSGVVSTEFVDNVVLSTVASLSAVPSGEAFGTPVITVEGGTINVSNVGNIASAEAFGTPQAQYVISWTGIVSAEQFGLPIVSERVSVSNVGNIETDEALGVPVLEVNTTMQSALSAEIFGIPTVTAIYDVTDVGPIPSAEAFGTPWLYLATKGNVMSGDAQLYAIRTAEAVLASIEYDDELIWKVRCTVSYPVGNVVRLTARFYDRDNQNLDPTVVACYIRVPGDPLKRLVYGIASEVIRESVGQYHIDVDTSEQVGDYSYKWVSSGVGQAANFIQKFSVSA